MAPVGHPASSGHCRQGPPEELQPSPSLGADASDPAFPLHLCSQLFQHSACGAMPPPLGGYRPPSTQRCGHAVLYTLDALRVLEHGLPTVPMGSVLSPSPIFTDGDVICAGVGAQFPCPSQCSAALCAGQGPQ